jgi:hypothetical protein
VPRYDQREQVIQGPPGLNQTSGPLVEITNRPYHNPHQNAYQITCQNTFHNTYQNAYELINKDGILADFDYTINKIQGTLENDVVQLGKTRESPFTQHFQANVGQVQQSRTTNFAPPTQEPTIKQEIQRVRQQRSEGESPRRNEMESCEWEAEFFDFEAATQYQ